MNGSVRPGAIVLVDTNVVIEAHRTGTWSALVGVYAVEMVEDCVTEAQTGNHLRVREQWTEPRDLRKSLGAVHEVDDRERAELAVRISGIVLDRGEESLWAHALARTGTWFLCGPDRASLRVGVRLQLRDRLVSMEELLDRAGHRPRHPLRPAYTRNWMERVVNGMVVAEIGGPVGAGHVQCDD